MFQGKRWKNGAEFIIFIIAVAFLFVLAYYLELDTAQKAVIIALGLSFLGIMTCAFFSKDRGGIPVLMPEDYVDKVIKLKLVRQYFSYEFLAIQEFESPKLLTDTHEVTWCSNAVAISIYNLPPREREQVLKRYAENIMSGKLTEIFLRGAEIEGGFIFYLVEGPPEDEASPGTS